MARAVYSVVGGAAVPAGRHTLVDMAGREQIATAVERFFAVDDPWVRPGPDGRRAAQ